MAEKRLHTSPADGRAPQAEAAASSALADFYRCPEALVAMTLAGDLQPQPGYFRFGADTICYGRSTLGAAHRPEDHLPDVLLDVMPGDALAVPFEVSEVLDNLRHERYAADGYRGRRPVLSSHPARHAYYAVRPMLSAPARKRVQQFFFRGWRDLRFPKWPVDTTVEQVLERLLVLSLKTRQLDAAPFIWFWPDGASSCVMLTHDVETGNGLDFVPGLMDLDDSFGFKASFQLIPRKQYAVSAALLETIRARGFEINVQDLDHDGDLFDDRRKFLARARTINRYVREYGARGFRAGRMYRNPEWLGALEIEYDMSVPNVAHLEPQRGGCCTAFPYFIGGILELPLTASQDYSLFHVLGDYSIGLWKTQLSLIAGRHGLASFIVHPDYIREERALAVYRQLLAHLSEFRDERRAWAALPAEVNRWWRERSRMQLVQSGGRWTVTGPGSERARVAWARLVDNRLVYSFEN